MRFYTHRSLGRNLHHRAFVSAFCEGARKRAALTVPVGFEATWFGHSPIYLSTVNVLFADGHVKAQKLDSIIDQKLINSKYVYTDWTVEND